MSREINKKLAVSIGSSARRARKSLELTQEDVAEQVEVSVEFYARIERGSALPSIRTFARIASALGVSADTLLGQAESKEGESRPALSALPESPEIRRLARSLRAADPSTVDFVDHVLVGIERLRVSRGLSTSAVRSDEPDEQDDG